MQTKQQFFEMLDKSQYWPADRLLAWQRQHLQLLLNHARTSSPFYRFRLNRVFRPNGGIDWDRWHEIPILRRSDLMTNFSSLLSTMPIPGHGPFQDVRSSGSTGHPVTVRTSRWLMEMTATSNWRAHMWAGLDWSQVLVGTFAPEPNRRLGEDLGTWGPPWMDRARRGRMLYTHYQTPFDDRLRLIAGEGARYHSTTYFAADQLALRAEETGAEVHLDAVLSRGGAVDDTLRARLKATFGAQTVDFYGSKEAGAIAARCPSGSGYHVNAESMFFEVVDENGVPVAPGESGRAVVTPFGSTAMPLIRYDQGDIVVAGSVCGCGRTLPHLHAISGRERVEFHHPDGRHHDHELPYEARVALGAGLVQIAQVGPRRFEIRYVRHDWGAPRDEPRFMALIREVLFEDSEIVLVEMPSIPLSPSGKFMAAVVEWRPDRL